MAIFVSREWRLASLLADVKACRFMGEREEICDVLVHIFLLETNALVMLICEL